MADKNVIRVEYPKKRKTIYINPKFIVIGIIVIILIVWAIFFRSSPQKEEPTQETEKQEEATASAKPQEATESAEPTAVDMDISNWYEYTDVEKTFSIKVPKGWFFDKTLKGPRNRGKILGGVADFNITKKSFDPEKNSAVYFELDAKESRKTLKNYATETACLRTTDAATDTKSCQDPTPPESQKTIKINGKDAIWQEIHGLTGIGIEAYVKKSDTGIFVLYSDGMINKTSEGFKVDQEFVKIIEAMLSTLKFL